MDTSSAPSQPFISLRTLRVATMVGAAALFAFGVFSWIAANWADFHRLAKLGLAGLLLLLATLTAILAPRTRTPALLVATAAVGALLALIGQIYQSGADVWQLFAFWTVLALPFAFAARHDSVWVLWTLVAGVAISLWYVQVEDPFFASFEYGQAWTLAIGLALVLTPLAPLRAITGGTQWAFRLACLGAIALVTLTGFTGLFNVAALEGNVVLAALVALTAAAVALTRLRPFEFGVLTLVFAGLDVLLIAVLFREIFVGGANVLTVLNIGLLAAAVVGGSVVLLRMIHARYAPRNPADKHGFSWPLAALSGFGALLAAVPFVGVYLLLFGENPSGAFIGGVLTLGGAIFMLRDSALFGFRQMFGFIAVVAAFLLISYGLIGAVDFELIGLVMAVVAAITAWFISVRWVGTVLGFAALLALISSAYFSQDSVLTFLMLMVAAGAAALIFNAEKTAALEPWQPFFSGWNVAGLLLLMLFAGRPFLIGGGMLGEFGDVIRASGDDSMLAVAAVLGLAGAAFIFWRRPELRTPLAFAVAACAVALTLRAPALGAAIVVFAAAMTVGSRSLLIAATLAIMWIISTFYYALSWSLTEKAYVLMALGAALGLALLLTRARSDGAVLERPRVASAATILIAFGAVATLGGAGASVFGAEQVLREGRVIYLELRPVDPRSLVQGDYMALNFNTDNLPSPYDLRGTTLALADVDARSVATLQTLIPADEQPAPNQILLQLRAKSGRWFVGSDAFFFQEGTGEIYEAAKYGQFRVGGSGRMLLTGLADADLNLLP